MALYSDPNQFTPTRRILFEDELSVLQSIENILGTTPGTRFFNPEFGSELEGILFEPIDDITAQKLRDALTTAIWRWDNRVRVDYANTFINAFPDDNKYEMQISFKIVGLEGRIFEFAGFLTRP